MASQALTKADHVIRQRCMTASLVFDTVRILASLYARLEME
jgi:hypothetical protein